MSKKDRRQRQLTATVTYLAMEARPKGPPPPPPHLKTAILRCEHPPVHFYRYLYDTIGQPYFWIERRLWNDDKLRSFLAQDRIALYALYLGGVPAGMAELDFHESGVGNINYFGLTPEFTGRHIGPWFLHHTVELCWAEPIKRLLVNTCTLDHKKALVTYQRAGFVAYARAERMVLVPPDFPNS